MFGLPIEALIAAWVLVPSGALVAAGTVAGARREEARRRRID